MRINQKNIIKALVENGVLIQKKRNKYLYYTTPRWKELVSVNGKNNSIENIQNILDYLNEVTGKKFKLSQYARQPINTRLKEGFTLEDFKQVIDTKTKEWLDDPKWDMYLRPQTLFGTKFESYLNQGVKKKPTIEFDTETYPEWKARISP